ncbi:MAG: serine/threonine protein kinase [Planctomycetales bacterium]
MRSLARDLPVFDSVWLDALVGLGRLTPFQAQLLESSDPGRIRVGSFLLETPLGAGPSGQTFRARTIPGKQTCAVKLLPLGGTPECLSSDALARLEGLCADLRGVSHPSLAPPQAVESTPQHLILASRLVPGFHLGELLVRRGRFSPAVVWELGRQLAEGLATLESRHLVHGDLRASNVRLSGQGVAVLVDVGIRAALDPELSVHTRLPPERYDGVAPELIGANSPPGVASDMYALGCLLWQLLAGRPPFPGGDPLVKLTAHRTRTIADVRNWAPDTPAGLAEGILSLTARDPARRPSSFNELLARWGEPSRPGRRRLAEFCRWFDRPAPRLKRDAAGSGRTPTRTVAACLIVALVVTVGLWRQGVRTALLAWGARLSQTLPGMAESESNSAAPREPDTHGTATGIGAESLQELPRPDQQGVVQLEGLGPYRAHDLTAVGRLTIRGPEGAPARIVVEGKPWRLAAEALRLESLQIEAGHPSEPGLPALVQIQAQRLELRSCILHDIAGDDVSQVIDSATPRAQRTAIAWELLDAKDPQGGVAAVRDSLFLGGDAALTAHDSASRVDFQNCLKLWGGPLCQWLAAPNRRRPLSVTLRQVTCRGTSCIVRFAPPADHPVRGSLAIETNDCVLDVGHQTGCLLELVTEQDWSPRTQWTGEGSLAPASLVAAWWIRDSEPGLPRQPTDLAIEGISGGAYQFAGPASEEPSNSRIADYDAPRRSSIAPGIDPDQLPRLRIVGIPSHATAP